MGFTYSITLQRLAFSLIVFSFSFYYSAIWMRYSNKKKKTKPKIPEPIPLQSLKDPVALFTRAESALNVSVLAKVQLG